MTALIAPFIALSLLGFSQDNAQDMLFSITAEEPLVNSAVVDAPVKAVWAAYTTTEGIKKWMVAEGEVSLRVGGVYRTSYKKGSDLTGPDTIENTILSYDPLKMVSMRTTKTPTNFPWKKAIEPTWTTLYFEPMGTKTKVICRMNGFQASEESLKLKKFFKEGNQQELDELVKFFKK